MLFVKSVNDYGKIFYRICNTPDYVMLALEKSHVDETGHGGYKKYIEKLR